MNALHALHAVMELSARLYAIGGELVSITCILASLNFLAGLVQKTYSLGRAIGILYYRYMHKGLKSLCISLIALTITCLIALYESIKFIYVNRHPLYLRANQIRNQVGGWFVYSSPVLSFVSA